MSIIFRVLLRRSCNLWKFCRRIHCVKDWGEMESDTVHVLILINVHLIQQMMVFLELLVLRLTTVTPVSVKMAIKVMEKHLVPVSISMRSRSPTLRRWRRTYKLRLRLLWLWWWIWRIWETALSNIDEYALNTHTGHWNSACTDNEGSFECDWAAGFDSDGNRNFGCIEINKCESPALNFNTNAKGEGVTCTQKWLTK